nr:immunoglobulin heavy chain junction region [Mus musculus]
CARSAFYNFYAMDYW